MARDRDRGRYVLSSAVNGDIQYLGRLKHFIRRPIKSTPYYSAKPNSALPNERRNINHARADESQGSTPVPRDQGDRYVMTAEYSWIAPRKRSWISQINSAVCFIPRVAMVVDVFGCVDGLIGSRLGFEGIGAAGNVHMVDGVG